MFGAVHIVIRHLLVTVAVEGIILGYDAILQRSRKNEGLIC